MEAQTVEALKTCQDVQHIIDTNSAHLERVRATFSNATDEITKQEIRTLEGKLIKHFSEQLAVKYGLGANNASDFLYFPSLSQWLTVVGVSSDTKDAICHRIRSLEELKDKTECELHRILLTSSRVSPAVRQEDLRRLCKSLQNLRKYTDVLVYGSKKYGPSADVAKMELHWDSWDQPQSKSECSSPKHDSMVPRPANLSTDDLLHHHSHQARSAPLPFSRPPPLVPSSVGGGRHHTVTGGGGGGDSAASSLSSSSSAPPPSPGGGLVCYGNSVSGVGGSGTTLSPPSLTESLPSCRGPLITPPATPPWVNLPKGDRHHPPLRQHHHTPPTNNKLLVGSSYKQEHGAAMSKSRSHESDLVLSDCPSDGRMDVVNTSGERVDSSGYSSASEAAIPYSRHRLHSVEPDHHNDYQGPSPIASPKSPIVIGASVNSVGSTSSGSSSVAAASISSSSGAAASVSSSLRVPKSPRTPQSAVSSIPTSSLPPNRPMTHTISHRFTKTFKPARCDYCQDYFFQGLKCKECKFRCHNTCENLVPPSCGLPDDLLKHFMNQLTSDGSPILPRAPPPPQSVSTHHLHNSHYGGQHHHHHHHHHHSHQQPQPFDSSSSSCNSSTPSSPQVIVTSHTTPPWAMRTGHHFRFPEPVSSVSKPNLPVGKGERVASPNPVDTVRSNDSDKTLSGSSDSIGTAYTYRLDSQDSTTSVEGDAASTWSSGRQVSIREWDIPYEELKIHDKIGSGRFSTVYMGNWHGDVAIKFLDMENLEDETTLEAFKLDVSTFRKTRHENLVLFMGACMTPPRLAIVTSLCKGNTLYTHLHLMKDKFYMNKVTIIAQQIAQGMGYLHHKGIVHKDLKTKNIFLENGRAIISDFGLVNVARRLCSRYKRPGVSDSAVSDCMSIPAGWLCYLAPEVIRELRVNQTGSEDLPFTRASDVYAFGTVWYELLTGEWPWKQQPPEAIIWQVGHGIKPSLANLQASREVKDILVQCWMYNPQQRPDFTSLLRTLERLPKKRLARSPSHPIQLSRSAESVF